MIDPKTIVKILETAVYAPSGDNSQPWHFKFSNNLLYIFSEPEKDNPKFNYRQRGTLIAHGALIENITIIAQGLGLNANVNYMPDQKDKNCTVIISFETTENKKNELEQYITKRCTNRKKYKDEKLTNELKNLLLKTSDGINGAKVLLTEEKAQKKIIGKAVGMNEVVMLEDKELHKYFFDDVRWDEQEEQKFKTGLFLKTMELEKPKEIAFKILSSWNRAKILTKLGLAKFIAYENSKIYSSGGAIGVIKVPNEDVNFLYAGRIMQRIWLEATKSGYSLQPITGIIYLAQRIKAGEISDLSADHVDIISKAYNSICSVFHIKDNEVLAMLFRIGKSQPASAFSSKLKPKIVFQ